MKVCVQYFFASILREKVRITEAFELPTNSKWLPIATHKPVFHNSINSHSIRIPVNVVGLYIINVWLNDDVFLHNKVSF